MFTWRTNFSWGLMTNQKQKMVSGFVGSALSLSLHLITFSLQTLHYCILSMHRNGVLFFAHSLVFPFIQLEPFATDANIYRVIDRWIEDINNNDEEAIASLLSFGHKNLNWVTKTQSELNKKKKSENACSEGQPMKNKFDRAKSL